MFSSLSILADAIIYLKSGYFAMESKQVEFHAHSGYCMQQIMHLHDDEWQTFCDKAGFLKSYRGSLVWKDMSSLSTVENELSEKTNKIVRFTKYRIHKEFYIGGSPRMILCVGTELPNCTTFFKNVRSSTTRPCLPDELLLRICRKSLSTRFSSIYREVDHLNQSLEKSNIQKAFHCIKEEVSNEIKVIMNENSLTESVLHNISIILERKKLSSLLHQLWCLGYNDTSVIQCHEVFINRCVDDKCERILFHRALRQCQTNSVCTMCKQERKNLKRKRARQAEADIADWTSPSSKVNISLLSEEKKVIR